MFEEGGKFIGHRIIPVSAIRPGDKTLHLFSRISHIGWRLVDIEIKVTYIRLYIFIIQFDKS